MVRRCCLGEEELDQFLLLALEEAADAVDYHTPVGMDVDSIRLESSQYLLLAAYPYSKRRRGLSHRRLRRTLGHAGQTGELRLGSGPRPNTQRCRQFPRGIDRNQNTTSGKTESRETCGGRAPWPSPQVGATGRGHRLCAGYPWHRGHRAKRRLRGQLWQLARSGVLRNRASPEKPTRKRSGPRNETH